MAAKKKAAKKRAPLKCVAPQQTFDLAMPVARLRNKTGPGGEPSWNPEFKEYAACWMEAWKARVNNGVGQGAVTAFLEAHNLPRSKSPQVGQWYRDLRDGRTISGRVREEGKPGKKHLAEWYRELAQIIEIEEKLRHDLEVVVKQRRRKEQGIAQAMEDWQA